MQMTREQEKLYKELRELEKRGLTETATYQATYDVFRETFED